MSRNLVILVNITKLKNIIQIIIQITKHVHLKTSRKSPMLNYKGPNKETNKSIKLLDTNIQKIPDVKKLGRIH